MKSLVLASLILGVSLYAQEALPLLPEVAPVAATTEQLPIPQQDVEDLLAQTITTPIADIPSPASAELALPAEAPAVENGVVPPPQGIMEAEPAATNSEDSSDVVSVPEDAVAPAEPVSTKSVAASSSTLSTAPLEEDEELDRLGKLPAYNLQTNKAPLSDVLALLADACQMGYVGLEKGLGDDVQISVNISKNPFDTLQYLCNRYNVALDYVDGIWRFGLYNDSGLIARIYHLRYNNQESVDASGSGSSSSSSDSSLQTTSISGLSSSSSSGSSSFSLNRDVIAKEIEKFMDLSSDHPSVAMAPDFDVNDQTTVDDRIINRVVPGISSRTDTKTAKGKVIYNSDNNSLYVLATRAQHQWIEKYILSVDKPQKQILVEAKIYETGLSPDQTMGLSWSGTVGRASVGGNQDSLLNGSSAAADLGGLTAILNSSALKASLQALSSNTDSVSVQYPRQVTVSNRSVTMSALEKVPVKDTTTTTDTNSDSQTQTEVNYIDVGTNITILPRIIDDNKIKMNINIKVSSIARYETIDNNDYPVVAEREYKTEAIVDDGYTLAIGGLRGSSLTDKTSEVPVISKLPLLGELFKHRSRSHSDTNLLIFISPQVLKENRGGMKEDPNFIVAKDQDYPERRTFKGTKDEEYTDVLLSLDGMDHEIDVQSQRVYEGLGIDGVEKTLRSLQNELALMKVRVREIALKNPNKDVSQATQKIEKYTADINELRKNINKRKAIFDR